MPTGINHIQPILIPENCRIGVTYAELKVFSGGVRPGKQGNDQQCGAEEGQGNAQGTPETQKGAQAEKQQGNSKNGERSRRLNPACQPGQGAQTTNAGKQRTGHRAERNGKQTGQGGKREAQCDKPEKNDQGAGNQDSGRIGQKHQQRKTLKKHQFRKQQAQLDAEGDDQRAEDGPQRAVLNEVHPLGKGCEPDKPEHGAEGQLKGGGGDLNRGEQRHHIQRRAQ